MIKILYKQNRKVKFIRKKAKLFLYFHKPKDIELLNNDIETKVTNKIKLLTKYKLVTYKFIHTLINVDYCYIVYKFVVIEIEVQKLNS